MAELYIAGTFLGILLVLLITQWIKSRRKRHSSIIRAQHPDAGDHSPDAAGILSSPITWAVAFIALIAGALVVSYAIIGDLAGVDIGTWDLIIATFGALFTGFISYNIYVVARNRGHSSALSLAHSVVVLALLASVGLAAMLIAG